MRSRMVTFLVVAGVGLGMTWVAHSQDSAVNAAGQEIVTKTVRERGVVESARSVEIRNELRGATLKSIVPNGSRVTQGSVVAEFEVEQLTSLRNNLRIQVATAKSGIKAAESKLESLGESRAVEIEAAKLGLQVAEMASDGYGGDNGGLAIQIREAERAVEIAEQRHELAAKIQRQLASQRDSGRVNEVTLLQAELSLAEAENVRTTTKDRLRLLREVSGPQQQVLLELQVAKARVELRTVMSESEIAIQDAESNLEVLKLKMENALQELEEVERMVSKTRILAPQDGIVLHARNVVGRRAANLDLSPGAQIRERQVVLTMPDLSKLRVRTLLDDKDVAKVKVGNAVAVGVDAFPNRKVKGKVVSVSESAEATQWFNNRVRAYAVIVELDEAPRGLAPGMTADVEILVEALIKDAGAK